MYSMKIISSVFFHLMMFTLKEKTMTINDHLTYHDPKSPSTSDNFLPTIEGILSIPSFFKVGLGAFKDHSLIRAFHGPSPHIPSEGTSQMCTITSNESYSNQLQSQLNPIQIIIKSWVNLPILQNPFLWATPWY